MVVARRVYLYGIAFAAIWVLINGIAGLLSVALDALVEAALGPFLSVGASRVADEVSFYGALTGLGLVVWAVHWGLAARTATRDPIGERRSAIRKLYLYGVLLIGGLLLTFKVRELLGDLLGLAFGTVGRTDLLNGDLVPPLAMLAATGAFWLYHVKVVRQDRAIVLEVGAGATIRRWCVYLLAFTGLMMLLFGLAGLLARLIDLATPAEAGSMNYGSWLAYDVAYRASTVLAALVVWLLAWWRSSRRLGLPPGPDHERESVLRKVYLYGVLLQVVSWTVWNLSQGLYLLLRAVLIPEHAGRLWSAVRGDLGETEATVLVFGVAWAYHARVLKREAAATPEHGRQATIRWVYGYIVSAVGAATFGSGLVGTIATVLDLLVEPGVARGEHWREERLALFATMIVVGLPVWLLSWLRLQREAGAAEARRSLARRIYLLLALGITVMTLLGSGAYTLYQFLRVALGERWTGSETSSLIDAGSAGVVAVLLLAYHLQLFQRDAALAKLDESTAPPAPAVVTAPPLDGALRSADADVLVTLLVVQAGSPEEAAGLRARLQSVLPPGRPASTTIDPPVRIGRSGTVTRSRILKSARSDAGVAVHAM